MKRTLLALVATALVVLGTDAVTFAATGTSLILGHANREKATTSLTNSHAGVALKLTTKNGSPPLAVSSSAEVKHLNAATVDGKSAAALTPKTYVDAWAPQAGAINANEVDFTIPAPPPGTYQVSWDALPLTSAGSAAAPNSLACYIEQNGVYYAGGSTASTSTQLIAFLTGTQAIKVPSKPTLQLVCLDDNGAVTLSFINGISMSFTQITVAKAGSLTVDP